MPPRRRVLTPIQLRQADLQARVWLGKKVIETIATPPLVNNLVLVAKKNGTIRVCVDCTPANQVTASFDWPLPRLQDLRYRTRGNAWFSRLDLKDAFFRIGVPEEYRRLTAFMVGDQAYQFRKMPFGLKTAPAIFQRWMDWGLARFSEWAFWYIDDILVMGRTRAELRSRESQLRAQLRDMKCEVNEEKSTSMQQGLLFAGIWIEERGVGPNVAKFDELRKLPIPHTRAEMQSALGLVSYLRDFIPLVSHFTALLYPDKQGLRLDNEALEVEWRRLCRHLEQALTINHHWKEGVEATLYTDASQYGLGAIVLQEGRVVALASRKLSPAETRYSATDREHLGLVYAAEKFRLFLHQSGAITKVMSDHAALVTRRPERMTPRQARWHVLVTHWMPRVEHVRGKDNPADFVSRWRTEDMGARILA